jgi:ppGpp synthetase/RelA/SpoT-type nucleotidyltranferase
MQEIISNFDESVELFERFKTKVHTIISDLIRDSKIQIHDISSRVKEREKLVEKIERKGG